MIRACAFLSVVLLAACGADGAPERPGGPSIDISATATIGIEGSAE